MRVRSLIRRLILPVFVITLASPFSPADERDELRERVQEVKKQASQLMEEGRREKAEQLLRENQGLFEKLRRVSEQGARDGEGRGPARGEPNPGQVNPVQLERMERAHQRLNHMRIAAEHLKQADMHDLALDLTRRAEDLERDLRQAKEKFAAQQRPRNPQQVAPGRNQPPRDQPPEGDRPHRDPQARPQQPGPGIDQQFEQLRNENRELRMMIERITKELRRDRE